MHFTSIVAAASVASVALAAPAPDLAPRAELTKRSFKVQSSRAVKLTPEQAMRRAFAKHGFAWEPLGAASSTSTSATETTDSDSIFPFSGSSTFSGGFGRAGRGGGGNAFRSWLSSIFASPTGLPTAGGGSGSAGSGSGSGGAGVSAPASAPAPAPTAPASSAPAENPQQPSATQAPAPSGTGGVVGEATNSPNPSESYYLTPVTIGGQTLDLDLDTGSADLWVFPSGSSQLGRNTKGFDSTASKTFQTIQGASFKIKYGDGSTASGTVGTDTVSIGAATVQKQAVELASNSNGQFGFTGLFGLGFSNVNTVQPQQQKTFFDNIKDSLAAPVFTVTLGQDGGAGEYEFGAIDPDKHTGTIQYTAVNPENGYWQFSSSSFKIGDQVQQGSSTPAIADTGTSLCLVDPAIVDAYYKQVQGAVAPSDTNGLGGGSASSAAGYTFPCGNGAPTPPDFSVAIGDDGAFATLPGAQLAYGPDDGSGMCFGGVQSNQGQQVQIYGDALLKANFAVFDGGAGANGSPRFGIAPASTKLTG